jgi:hypothetical protein
MTDELFLKTFMTAGFAAIRLRAPADSNPPKLAKQA